MLTDSAIRAAKSKTGQTVKLSDGGGLQLWVQPSGSKLWNLAYRFAGKQRKLAIGSYPSIGLKEARARREEAKKLLASGFDPSQQKRLIKLDSETQKTDTFEAISREVLEKKRQEGKSETTVSKAEWLFDIATPALGPRPIVFRAAASSLLNECGKWNADAIEAQLAHVEANAVRKAYARAEYWAERVEMMAYWADWLDELRRGGIVVPLRA